MSIETYQVHLLDVGEKRFGDSILAIFGDTRILIDGGHPGDDDRILAQINALLGDGRIDLLVVTHCHADHVGCLPSLFRRRSLTCEWALLADPDWGLGQLPGFDQDLAAALREEPIADGTDAEIAALLSDAVKIGRGYRELVEALKDSLKDRCCVFRGLSETDTPGLNKLISAFRHTGLLVAGPSRRQLELCRDRAVRPPSIPVRPAIADDSAVDPITSYRRYFTACPSSDNGKFLSDAAGLSAAVNCQSLILAIGPASRRTLLTGDMQFADPGFRSPELRGELGALRTYLASMAPFVFVKAPHHGSLNGFSAEQVTEWQLTHCGVSTGSRGHGHPHADVVRVLDDGQIHWKSTGTYGRVTFHSEGTLVHLKPDVPGLSPLPTPPTPPPWPPTGASSELAQGRVLPSLLFVTSFDRLRTVLGDACAAAVADLLRGQSVCHPDRIEAELENGQYEGVVLVGGPRIIPLRGADTLPAELRSAYGRVDQLRDLDGDAFHTWDDGLWIPPARSLPVSRIPDGGVPGILLTGLCAGAFVWNGTGLAVRNQRRPYADRHFSAVTNGQMYVSIPVRLPGAPPPAEPGPLLYLALHMDEGDGSVARGECDVDGIIEAVDAGILAGQNFSLIFAACCWSACLADRSFQNTPRSAEVGIRSFDESLALAAIAAGANAFAGFSGTHLPPDDEPEFLDRAGEVHQEFFRSLAAGQSAASAVWHARKVGYANAVASLSAESGPLKFSRAFGFAERFKIARSFQCLGLGW